MLGARVWPLCLVRETKKMLVADMVASSEWLDPSSQTLMWLARLLREEGIDLTEAGRPELARGTPVYVEASADVNDVQRLMAREHIRRLPVVDGDRLVGVIDLVDLALREEAP